MGPLPWKHEHHHTHHKKANVPLALLEGLAIGGGENAMNHYLTDQNAIPPDPDEVAHDEELMRIANAAREFLGHHGGVQAPPIVDNEKRAEDPNITMDLQPRRLPPPPASGQIMSTDKDHWKRRLELLEQKRVFLDPSTLAALGFLGSGGIAAGVVAGLAPRGRRFEGSFGGASRAFLRGLQTEGRHRSSMGDGRCDPHHVRLRGRGGTDQPHRA
jgi:hypothetical protein